MAQAWLIAEAYIKCKQQTIVYLKKKSSLDKWTFNKAIQKKFVSQIECQKEKTRIEKNEKSNY